MNSAYKHLEAKLKIAELTVGQWGGLFLGTLMAVVWANYLTPFGPSLTLITAIYIGGLPAVAVFTASFSDFDFWLLARSAIRYRRVELRYLAGAGVGARGYTVAVRAAAETEGATARPEAIDLNALWDA